MSVSDIMGGGMNSVIPFIIMGFIIIGVATSMSLEVGSSSTSCTQCMEDYDVLTFTSNSYDATDHNIGIGYSKADHVWLDFPAVPDENVVALPGEIKFNGYSWKDGNLAELRGTIKINVEYDAERDDTVGFFLFSGALDANSDNDDINLFAIGPNFDDSDTDHIGAKLVAFTNGTYSGPSFSFAEYSSTREPPSMLDLYTGFIESTPDTNNGGGYFTEVDYATTDSNAGDAIWEFSLDENRTYLIESDIMAQSQDGNSAGYKIQGLFTRGPGGDVTQVGSTSTLSTFETTASMDADFNADTTNQEIDIVVTGLLSTSMDWKVTTRYMALYEE